MTDQFIAIAPRPWFAQTNAVVYVDHGCRRTICHITGADFTRDATEDHARFIAHACNCHADLLDALTDLVERDRAEAAECGFSDDEMSWLDDARRAIAKATARGGVR